MPAELLFIHHDGSISGSGISLRNLLAELDRGQFKPRVLLGREGPVRKLFEQINVPVDYLPIRTFWTAPGSRWYQPGWFLNWMAFLPNTELQEYLRRLKPDLVHINDKAAIAAGLAARKSDIPVIWHIRSSYFPSHSQLQAKVSRHFIRAIAQEMVVISEDELDGFEDYPRKTIVHNSVDFQQCEAASAQREKIRRELGITEQQVLIGQVSATINRVRGTFDFLQACGDISRSIAELEPRFVVVAGIPPRTKKTLAQRLRPKELHPEDEARSIASQENITQQLTFTGFRKDGLSLMAAMDVVVVCNRHGVMGRMPFEAMAMGKPLVVTAGHSGKSSVVIDGKTALVVPPANPKAISDAVIKLIKDGQLSKSLSQSGKSYAREHFDPQKNARLIEDIYRKLLAGSA